MSRATSAYSRLATPHHAASSMGTPRASSSVPVAPSITTTCALARRAFRCSTGAALIGRPHRDDPGSAEPGLFQDQHDLRVDHDAVHVLLGDVDAVDVEADVHAGLHRDHVEGFPED